MNKTDDPYEILGVPYDADDSKIRKAYFKLARQHHPDKQTTDEEKEKSTTVFARISGAYEVLTDPVKRYDWKQANESKMKGGASSSSSPTPSRATTPPPPTNHRSPKMQHRASSTVRPSTKPTSPNMSWEWKRSQPNTARSRTPPPPNTARSRTPPPPTRRRQGAMNPEHGIPQPQEENPFDVLGLNWNADRVEILEAYRKLAISCHPSKQHSDEDRIRANLRLGQVKRAYEQLMKDPGAKAKWSTKARAAQFQRNQHVASSLKKNNKNKRSSDPLSSQSAHVRRSGPPPGARRPLSKSNSFKRPTTAKRRGSDDPLGAQSAHVRRTSAPVGPMPRRSSFTGAQKAPVSPKRTSTANRPAPPKRTSTLSTASDDSTENASPLTPTEKKKKSKSLMKKSKKLGKKLAGPLVGSKSKKDKKKKDKNSKKENGGEQAFTWKREPSQKLVSSNSLETAATAGSSGSMLAQ